VGAITPLFLRQEKDLVFLRQEKDLRDHGEDAPFTVFCQRRTFCELYIFQNSVFKKEAEMQPTAHLSFESSLDS
jgi:hypothetical protein